jgi:hypothetical protein
MKTILTTLLLMTALASTTLAQDQPQNTRSTTCQTGMYTTAEGKLNINLEKQKGQPVHLRLVNHKGTVLFDERIPKNLTRVSRRLDLSELPDGVYQVVVVDGQERTAHQVTVNTKPAPTATRLVALN